MRPRQRPAPRRSPHIGNSAGAIKDYNGVETWSVEAIQERYRRYADALGTRTVPLAPTRHIEKGHTWIFPLMQQVIELIDDGDRAAIEIGIEFISEDDFFVFGKILKSNTARALRRAALTEEQKARVRERLVAMLLSGQVPHEWGEYKRLLRTVGLGPLWPVLEKGVDRENKFVMRHYAYLDRFAR